MKLHDELPETRYVGDVLRVLHDLLQDPQQWCRGENGLKLDGTPLHHFDDPEACKVCLLGGLYWIQCRNGHDWGLWGRAKAFLSDVICQLYPERARGFDDSRDTITAFNDHPLTTHEDILEVLDRAHDQYCVDVFRLNTKF